MTGAGLPDATVRELMAVGAGFCPVHGVPLEPGSHLELWDDGRARRERVTSPGSWCEPCGAWWAADAEALAVTKRWPFPDPRLL